MGLMPAINKKRTLERAKIVLSAYQSLQRIANEGIEPKVTAIYTFEPRGYTGKVSKAIENSVVRKVNAQQMIEKIEKAINAIHDTHRRVLLIEKYCLNDCKDVEIMEKVNMYDSEFYRELDNALFWFAEHYDNGSLYIFDEESDGYELLGEQLSV